MALRYFAGLMRDIDKHHVAELNALVLEFALPAALFVVTVTFRRPAQPGLSRPLLAQENYT